MSTSGGPAPGDANDPELWEGWYEDDDAVARRAFGWPARALAILLVVTLAILMVMAG